MQRSNPARVALSSSLALLLGAGVPLQQIAAQERPADPASLRAPASPGSSLVQSQGFEMVPGAAPKDVLPKRTVETPGANGFELLPASAGDAASQTAATVAPRSADLVTDPSGFQMLAPAAAAVSLAQAPNLELKSALSTAPVSASLPQVDAAQAPAFAAPQKMAATAALAPVQSTPAEPTPVHAARTAMVVHALSAVAADLRPLLKPVHASAPTAFIAPEPEPAPVQLASTALTLKAPEVVPTDVRPLLEPIRAATPSVVLAPEPAAAPVQLQRTVLVVKAPETVPADLQPLLETVHASAPSMVLAAEPEVALVPISLAAAQPLDLTVEAAPVLEERASRRRVRRRLPVLVLNPVTQRSGRPKLQLAAAPPMFLQAPAALMDTGFRRSRLTQSIPGLALASDTEEAALQLVSTVPAPRVAVEAAPRLILASFEAPSAARPQLVRPALTPPEVTIAAGGDQSASSAEAIARPVALSLHSEGWQQCV